MRVTLAKATEVLEVKESAAGLILKVIQVPISDRCKLSLT